MSAATFRDGVSGASVVDEADVLVGADGIHSAVRRQLYPAEGEPRFARQVLWRAAVDAEAFLGGHTMIIAGHFHQRIIVYPIGPGSTPGSLRTNWICQTDGLGCRPAARGLEPARRERKSPGGIRRLAISLARHAGADRSHIGASTNFRWSIAIP